MKPCCSWTFGRFMFVLLLHPDTPSSSNLSLYSLGIFNLHYSSAYTVWASSTSTTHLLLAFGFSGFICTLWLCYAPPSSFCLLYNELTLQLLSLCYVYVYGCELNF